MKLSAQQTREVGARVLTVVLLLAIGGVGGYHLATSGTLFGLKLPFLELVQPEDVYRISYSGQPKRYKDVNFDLFWGVWDLLDKRFYKPTEMNGDQMVDGAIAGMVAALNDPYTMYIPKETNTISQQDMSGSFGGLGVELGYVNINGSWVVGVQAPMSGTPAERAGVMAGDAIIHVRDEKKGLDEDTYDWSTSKAQQNLRGEIGSKVVLTLYREGYNDNAPFEVEITREEILVDSLTWEIMERDDKKYAYMKLSRFGERTYDEWNEAVNAIAAQKDELSGVILDLRNNPGGYFNEAIHVASEFVKDGVVVIEKNKTTSRDYNASGKGRLTDIPLVVLVNGGSASSSEIVAGAIRDHQRGKLVGSKTFGKGLIQERLELINDAGLNVTVAQWMLPGGDWLDQNGIEPDVMVEANNTQQEGVVDNVLERAFSVFD